MITITGGYDSVLYFDPETTPTATPTVKVYDAAGTQVTIAGTMASGSDGRYSLTLQGSETDDLVGQTCTAVTTWTYGSLDAVDIREFYVTSAQAQDTDSPLATRGDLERYGYATTASRYIPRASARVRGYTRQEIASGTSTVSLRYPFVLPQRPVSSITSVTYLSGDGSTVTLAATEDYTVEGQRLVADAYKDQRLTVTYTYGMATLPPELVEVVCAIAARMAEQPSALQQGVTSEAADGESIGYGGDAYAGVAELTGGERKVLDRIFPHTRSVPRVAMTL